MSKSIAELDVNNIPLSGLDHYTKDDLVLIARYAVQAHDIKLLKIRWQLLEDTTTKPELIKIIKRCNDWGTRA